MRHRSCVWRFHDAQDPFSTTSANHGASEQVIRADVRNHQCVSEAAASRRSEPRYVATARAGYRFKHFNLEEADAASSDADFLAKMRISLREIKEARVVMRVIVQCKLAEHEMLAKYLDEAGQLFILQSDPASSPGTIGRVRGSRPSRAMLPTKA